MTRGARVGWFIVGALVIASAVGLGLKPAYRGLKSWRSAHIANGAVADYLSDPTNPDGVTSAALRARSALELDPHGFPANRALGILLTGVRPAEALYFWDRAVAVRPDLSSGDSLAYTQCLFVNREWDRAEALLSELGSEMKDDPAWDYNMSKLRYLQGRQSEALEYSRQMMQKGGVLERSQRLHGIGLAYEIGNESDKRVALEAAEALVSAGDGLWELLSMENLPDALRASVSAKLRGGPRSFEETLTLADYEISFGVGDALDYFDGLSQHVDLQDEVRRHMLVRWCLGHDIPEQALEILPESRALERRDAFLLHIQVLTRLERWDRIRDLLGRKDLPLELFWQYLLQAELELGTGDAAKAAHLWNRARSLSDGSREQLWLLLRPGDRIGGDDRTTNRMMGDLVLSGESVDAVRSYLLDRLARDGNFDRFLESLRTLKVRFGEQAEWVNDWAYFSIVMGRDSEEALAEVNRIIEKEPSKLAYHMTWAMAMVIRGEPREVLERLRHFKVDWESLAPRWRMILALALASVGEKEQAEHYMQGIDPAGLSPYEADLVRRLMGEPAS